MKKTVNLALVFVFLFSFNACSEAESASTKDVVSGFFTAFENSDYEAMKSYCTKECIDSYFHENDVDGMKWAKATKIEDVYDENTIQADMYAFYVNVEMETSKNSALYGEKQTSFYVLLRQDEAGSWKINSFMTGL